MQWSPRNRTGDDDDDKDDSDADDVTDDVTTGAEVGRKDREDKDEDDEDIVVDGSEYFPSLLIDMTDLIFMYKYQKML